MYRATLYSLTLFGYLGLATSFYVGIVLPMADLENNVRSALASRP